MRLAAHLHLRDSSAVAEYVEFVAIQVAEVGGVEALAALGARPGGPSRCRRVQVLLVDSIDLVARIDPMPPSRHAHRGRPSVVGF